MMLFQVLSYSVPNMDSSNLPLSGLWLLDILLPPFFNGVSNFLSSNHPVLLATKSYIYIAPLMQAQVPERLTTNSATNTSSLHFIENLMKQENLISSYSFFLQWDLVCENNWKGPFSSSVFFMGMLTGSFFSGHLSDRYGRKFILFASITVQTVFGLIEMASQSWEMFCVFYFVIGFGLISIYVTAFVLGTELLGKSMRLAFGTVGIPMFFSVGYIFLPLFAYFIRDWRTLLLAMSLPGFLYVPLWWFIPESPRWLHSQGRVEEAEAIFKAAAKQNGITHVGVIFTRRESTLHNPRISDQDVLTYLDLFRTSNIRNITILFFFIWIVTSMTYFGLSVNTSNMNGNPYINCFISAASEIGAYLFTWWLLPTALRRITTASMLSLGGTLLLLIQLVPANVYVITTALAMIGKFAITSAFIIIYIYAAELYPTVLRNMGVGACSTVSRIGAIISPYVFYLGLYNIVLPLMGLLVVVAGALCLILPETRDQSLPETVQQTQPIRCTSKYFSKHFIYNYCQMQQQMPTNSNKVNNNLL
uniref:Solute carrier family 22 member 4-like n=1 Tax=Callorhinchus milii TaxID=7868 RepID=A0A4W3IXS4_CALMI